MKILVVLLLCVSSNAFARSITLDSLHHEFEHYLSGPKQPPIVFEGHSYDQYELKFEPDPTSLLAAFAKDNKRVLQYFGSNYSELQGEYLYSHRSDSARFHTMVADSQWRNLYFERLTQLMARYL